MSEMSQTDPAERDTWEGTLALGFQEEMQHQADTSTEDFAPGTTYD